MNVDPFDGARPIGRRDFLRANIAAMGCGLLFESLRHHASAAQKETLPSSHLLGSSILLKGLDGMSRSAITGRNPFSDGHNAAAVIASAFFCQEQRVNIETQRALMTFLEKQLLPNQIYQSQPQEEPDNDLTKGLLEDLYDGIGDLRRSGHNIIFAVLSLKALRAVPEAATPKRIAGLRKMVTSFRKPDPNVAVPDDENLPHLSDETAFIRFVFKEYLSALDLYLHGKGHHGFAGHMLTVGHALVDLKRMGHEEIAREGLTAFWQFVGEARKGADRGGRRVPDPPSGLPRAMDQGYWRWNKGTQQRQLVSSHHIKYPYSFYALSKEVDDEALLKRALEQVSHLRAVS